MREFKNYKNSIYLNDEKYYKIEEEYVNSKNFYNEKDYYNFEKLDFYESKKEIEANIDKKTKSENLNREFYVYDFINKFLRIFTNVYTIEELKKKLDENVNHIYFQEKENCIGGNYIFERKTINVMEKKETIFFHEFVHSLRGRESMIDIPEISGLIEGFTKYAECVFMCLKRNEYKKTYNKDYFIYLSDKKNVLTSIPSYYNLLLIVEQICLLYNEISNNDKSLLEIYLSGGNIYKEISKIYAKYFEECMKLYDENYDDIEKLSKISTIKLILKINNIYNIIRMYVDNEENFLNNNNNELLKYIEEIEKELCLIKKMNSINYDTRKFNKLLLTKNVKTNEEKLLEALFGTNEKQKRLKI